jgi:hypothetical protein
MAAQLLMKPIIDALGNLVGRGLEGTFETFVRL